MGKIKAHGIAFEGAETFDAGSKIKGHVYVELAQPLKARGIRLLFRGSAEVKWTETKSEYDVAQQRSRARTVTYRSTENYLKHSILLHGVRANQGNITIEMPPGRHKFPFTFTLPRTLPASFEGEYGFVRYYAESNIDLPWKFDPKSKRSFKVRPIADLNLDTINRCGLSAENEKNLCCLCCSSGPISATFKIQQQGFVPGQAIKIFSEISNDSDKIIDKTYVYLKRTTTFYAKGKRKTETKKIATVTRPAISPHGKDAWRGQSLIVPPTPPSGFPGCSIIDVAYQLKLNVVPAGLSLDLEIPFKINIGTIPVRQQQRRVQPSAPQRDIEESLVNFAAQTSTVPSYESTVTTPPRYEEYASAPPAEDEEAPPSYEENASAPSAEDEQAPPSYEYAAAHPEDYKEDDEDEQGDAKLITKGGYQRFS